jgi:transcriptional regulator with XRE-family HTH domain
MIGLEYLLELASMSQLELSDKLNTTKQNVNMWVKGKQKIPKKYLPALEEIFHTSSIYINKVINDEIDKINVKEIFLSYNSLDEESLKLEMYKEKMIADIKLKLYEINSIDKLKNIHISINLILKEDTLSQLEKELNIAVENKDYILAGDIQKQINKITQINNSLSKQL